MKKILSILFLILSQISFAQNEIKEYTANEKMYLVGDRVFSLYYITPKGVIVIDPINDKIAAEIYNQFADIQIFL